MILIANRLILKTVPDIVQQKRAVIDMFCSVYFISHFFTCCFNFTVNYFILLELRPKRAYVAILLLVLKAIDKCWNVGFYFWLTIKTPSWLAVLSHQRSRYSSNLYWLIYPFPHIDAFWSLCSRWLFENIVTKRAISPFYTMFSTFSHRLSIQL